MIDFAKLKEPFPATDIEWRAAQAGDNNGKPWIKVLAYVTNRAIMERLDDVCGPENWRNEFKEGPHGGVLCGLSVRVGDEWVTKWDGADNTNIEAVKGGLSGAMKRAGSQWGIGRYLYNLDEGWGIIADKGQYSAKGKDNKWFKWNPPELPDWALPAKSKGATQPKPPTPPPVPADKLTPEQFASKWEKLTPDALQKWSDTYWNVVEQNFMGDEAGLKKAEEYLEDRWKALKKEGK